MFLKRMTLFGFKSFAEKTDISFQDGVTALLGPNGCGKSNIVDAIKWVLGEQSTRNMRAESMSDVIFNGTEQRKALNVAEVSLTIANEENLLELDVPEIEVKRRLFRSGESEYYINNTPVRLKELRELFMDTGIGKSAYSIMEQGKIDQILSSKPEERRYIFEEAAGITRFKLQGAEAERKLKKTEENMVQVDNILHEVKKNHDSLKKQSEKTVTYRKIKDQIFSQEVLLRRLQLIKLEQRKESHIKKRDTMREKLERFNNEVNSLSVNLQEQHQQKDSMESKLIDIQKRLYGLDIEQENKQNQIRMIQERRQEFKTEEKTMVLREQQHRDRNRDLETQFKEREKEAQGIADRIGEIDKSILSLEKQIETSEKAIGENQEQEKIQRSEILEMEQKREALQEELRVLTQHIVTELDSGLKDSGYSLARKNRLMEELHSQIDALIIQFRGKGERINDTLTAKADLSILLEDIKTGLQDWESSIEGAVQKIDELDGIFPAFLEEFLSPQGIIIQRRENEEATEALQRRIREILANIEILQKKNIELQEKIEESRGLLEDYRVNRVRLSTQKAAVEDGQSALKAMMEKEREQLESTLELLAQVQKKISQLDQSIKDNEGEIEGFKKERLNLQNELAELEKGIKKSSTDLAGQEKSLIEKKKNIQDNIIAVEKSEMEINHLSEEVEQLLSDFTDRYSRDLNEFQEEIPQDLSVQEIRQASSEKKQQLRQLGQVNLMAPEEFSEVKERYDFLNNQMEDLRTARTHLSEVTKEIRRESEQRFTKTFKQIEENFHQMFRQLFGGGRGEFKLSEPDNVLESGIEIYAQPPGKKLENIALLSGGEKSLTGVGLLFATYLVKPSPFCILDEMDAALDDANIQRFVHVLMDFAERSQFIVITHNKKTVTGARTLLGVTMEETGISRLVSMRLGEEA